MGKEETWLLEEKYQGVASATYEADKARLAGGEPLAYVISWQPFLGLKIYLDSKPLIPRPETEHWVENLVSEVLRRQSQGRARSGPKGDAAKSLPRGQVLPPSSAPSAPSSLRFLDLCSGSGAIGCAILKHFPTAHVSFGEIDLVHEATIRKNIRENSLDESRADIRIGDLFTPFEHDPPAGGFDYIVANPPYIPLARELETSVVDYEPALALYAGEDGLDLIRRIAEGLRRHLAPGGEAWLECDSEHAEAARALFEERGFAVRLEKDQFGRERLLVIS